MFNLLVIALSAVALAFVLVWWRRPALRAWMEAPKHRMLAQEERYGRGGPSAAPRDASERAR